MIIVLDTSVLISTAMFPQSRLAQKVVGLMENEHVIYSKETLHELETTLTKQKFVKYYTSEQREVFVEMYMDFSHFVHVKSEITACRDASDNKFLALAVDGKADAIITGDEDLLMLHPFRKIKIMTIEKFK